jgi:hypothetical protein
VQRTLYEADREAFREAFHAFCERAICARRGSVGTKLYAGERITRIYGVTTEIIKEIIGESLGL